MTDLRDLSDRFSLVEKSLRKSEASLNQKLGKRQSLLETKSKAETSIEDLKRELEILGEVTEVLQHLVSLKREEVQTKIENLVTYGLRTIFEEDLTFKIDTGTRAKQTTMEFKVVHSVKGQQVETDILNAHGGGLIQVVALLLRIVVLLFARPAPRRVLILDESLAHLSRDYLGNAGELLKQLSERLKIQVLMVTHSPEFIEYADRVYEFSQKDGVTQVSSVS